jgi:hypothetical protein
MILTRLKEAAEFGVELVRTGDLDPVYIAMAKSGLSNNDLKRLILSYSCLYHLGASAALSRYRGKPFFDRLNEAALNANGRWPRGTERRHWRGSAATDTVAYLSQKFSSPETVVDFWAKGPGLDFKSVTDRVKEAAGFGPWIAFKVADLLERILRVPVDFTNCHLDIYRDPKQGAALLIHGDKDVAVSGEDVQRAISALLLHPKLRHLKAPPWNDRLLFVQEAETILCKYKSHCNGHYSIGKDTKEVLHALEAGWGETAVQLQKGLRSWPTLSL